MAKKRKNETKQSEEPNQANKKQQQESALRQQQQQQEEEQEEVEAKEFEPEEEQNENENNNNNNNNEAEEEENEEEDEEDEKGEDEDDEDDEPIEKLLEPFGKEKVVSLLAEAANKHKDIADRIRRIADEDPAHRKIFVYGLGWDTTAETLITNFKQYGEIEDCKAVSDKVSGKSKGYGFILFKSRKGARNALKQPQKKIGNRVTSCQLASVGPAPAPGAASASSGPVNQPVSEYTQRKIYVSNVGADLDPQKLMTFFSKFGEVEEGPLGLDKLTGKPKGFCLFVYKSVEGAKKALEEPHKNFEGHVLHCQKAIDGPKMGKGQMQQQPHHHHRKQYQRNDSAGGAGAYPGGNAASSAHLMAPATAGPGLGAATPGLNPALGQALTALLATQGAGLGLSNILGSMGPTAAVDQSGMPVAATGMQGAYGTQPVAPAGMQGAYASQTMAAYQGAVQGGYPTPQLGQGSGRGQYAGGQYGGVGPYMGH